MTIRYRGRYVRTRVIDRGPFSDKYSYDLTEATKRELRFATGGIRVTYERR